VKDDVASIFEELEATVRTEMEAEGIPAAELTMARFVDARYAGQSHELRVPAGDWIEALHRAHEERYGYANRESVAEAVTLRVEATSPAPAAPLYQSTIAAAAPRRQRVYCGDGWRAAPAAPRDSVTGPVFGPAIITEYSATTWIPEGWQVEGLDNGVLLMGRV
jgi:N-methylhydantoinase A/oxoprolinase/acetone carboxylase beta subunit